MHSLRYFKHSFQAFIGLVALCNIQNSNRKRERHDASMRSVNAVSDRFDLIMPCSAELFFTEMKPFLMLILQLPKGVSLY